MKCPLFVMARLEAGAPQDTKLIYCLKEECAWWDIGGQKCAILRLAISVSWLDGALEKIKDKMPHEG